VFNVEREVIPDRDALARLPEAGFRTLGRKPSEQSCRGDSCATDGPQVLREPADPLTQVSRPAPGGRAVGREDSAVVTCCAHLGHGGIIMGVRRGCPRKNLGALSL
jgi:hypothetical protein